MPISARFYQAIRRFAVSTKIWGEAIRYQTKPDERYDLTLASFRVYGNRDEHLVIRAAAGLDRSDDILTERVLVLPTAAQLAQIKADSGFVGP